MCWSVSTGSPWSAKRARSVNDQARCPTEDLRVESPGAVPELGSDLTPELSHLRSGKVRRHLVSVEREAGVPGELEVEAASKLLELGADGRLVKRRITDEGLGVLSEPQWAVHLRFDVVIEAAPWLASWGRTVDQELDETSNARRLEAEQQRRAPLDHRSVAARLRGLEQGCNHRLEDLHGAEDDPRLGRAVAEAERATGEDVAAKPQMTGAEAGTGPVEVANEVEAAVLRSLGGERADLLVGAGEEVLLEAFPDTAEAPLEMPVSNWLR
jgi:hypothetical protein